MEESQGVKRQNVRQFTIGVLRSGSDEIIGTGVVVAPTGQAITCAHVVRDALGDPPADITGSSLELRFPKLPRDQRRRTATVRTVLAGHEDDIALLELDQPISLPADSVAVLGRADESEGNTFESYGYRRLAAYRAARATGEIQGSVEAPEDGEYLTEPIQLSSGQISGGMSGAPVLDRERNLVVGLISETWFAGDELKDLDTAWAVDAEVLGANGFDLPLRTDPLPLAAISKPRTDVGEARAAVADDLEAHLAEAPELFDEFVGRDDLLAAVAADIDDPSTHITALIGLGGEGKSSIARRALDDVLAQPEARPDAIFWWDFTRRPSVEEFFGELVAYMSRGKIDPKRLQSASTHAQIVGAMLGQGRHLFVLDGLERVQSNEPDSRGEIPSHPLLEFLTYVADPDHHSHALITSRLPLADLTPFATVAERSVERLTSSEGVALLRNTGCTGDVATLADVVERWGGHALAIALLGRYVADVFGGDASHAASIPLPAVDPDGYERVRSILLQYDSIFGPVEFGIIAVVSLCRRPIPRWFTHELFEDPDERPDMVAPLGDDIGHRDAALRRLEQLGVVTADSVVDQLSAHPLVSEFYRARLAGTDGVDDLHELLSMAYLSAAGLSPEAAFDEHTEVYDLDELPPFEELLPLVEAVHHACAAGLFGGAIAIHHLRINQGMHSYLGVRYGAYQTDLDICRGFFPGGDLNAKPVFDSYQNRAGLALVGLGRLPEAIDLLNRNLESRVELREWRDASMNLPILADARERLGELEAAERSLVLALHYQDLWAEEEGDPEGEIPVKRFSYLAGLAWLNTLRGDEGVSPGPVRGGDPASGCSRLRADRRRRGPVGSVAHAPRSLRRRARGRVGTPRVDVEEDRSPRRSRQRARGSSRGGCRHGPRRGGKNPQRLGASRPTARCADPRTASARPSWITCRIER